MVHHHVFQLNGMACAVPWTIIALAENNQNEVHASVVRCACVWWEVCVGMVCVEKVCVCAWCLEPSLA